MNKLNPQKEPIRANEVIKTAVWLLGILVSAGYISGNEAEQINVYIPVFAMAASLVINWVITKYRQRDNVTPWTAENPLVKYPEDPTPY